VLQALGEAIDSGSGFRVHVLYISVYTHMLNIDRIGNHIYGPYILYIYMLKQEIIYMNMYNSIIEYV
jgi:hypothetical protein